MPSTMRPKSFDLPPVGPSRLMTSQFVKAHLPPKTMSCKGQTILLTGGNTGIGYACAEWLVELGVTRLILGCRNITTGETAASNLRKKSRNVKIEVWKMDMESFESVQALAEQAKTLDRLDVAILNAGMTGEAFNKSPTGHERMIQVNYHATALLAILLLPILKQKSPSGVPGRLTIVGSGTVLTAKFNERHSDRILDAFDDANKYDKWDHYASTKACFLPFLWKLSEQVNRNDVVINVVDPGLTKGTQLTRDISGVNGAIFAVVKALIARNARNAATTYIDAVATQGPESHGCYVMDWKIYTYPGYMHEKDAEEVARKIWRETMSELAFANVKDIIEGL